MGKKHKCTIPQKGPNWAQKKAIDRSVMQFADFQTERQYMMDMVFLALNEEFGFGRERLKRLYSAWSRKYDAYREAVTKLPEADYAREKLDEALKAILQDDFQPFMERYDFLKEVRTGAKK